GKVVPLRGRVLGGLGLVAFRPALALDHLTPFVPLGWKGFGPAILLIFWAYAGFELAALPAGEVRDPRRTLPRGLVVGVAIATLFYLLTAFAVVVALPWQVSAASPRPLADALGAIFAAFAVPAAFGGILMSLGALVSIVGVFDVFTLCVARLSYAMAVDGLFPAAFRRLHPRSRTPLVGLLFQGASALVFSVFFDLGSLISIAVFFLGICYVLTALAALRLVAQAPNRRLHVPAVRVLLALAALSGAYLSAQAPLSLIALGLVVLVA